MVERKKFFFLFSQQNPSIEKMNRKNNTTDNNINIANDFSFFLSLSLPNTSFSWILVEFLVSIAVDDMLYIYMYTYKVGSFIASWWWLDEILN